jgi:hypothetical protein
MKNFWLRLGIGCAGIPFGGIFLTIGLLVGLVFAKQYAFECERLSPQTDEGNCELTAAGFRGTETTSFPISELQGARVASNYDSEDRSTTYRVEILTERGELPITPVWSSGQQSKQEMADEIEQFAQNQSISNLAIAQDDRWFGYLFLFIFGGVGLAMIVVPVLLAIFLRFNSNPSKPQQE